jgi:hypothetical protein
MLHPHGEEGMPAGAVSRRFWTGAECCRLPCKAGTSGATPKGSPRTRRTRPRLCRTRACFLRRGTCVRTPHTCARARPLGRTSASPRRSHPVGRGSRRRPPARPRPRAAWGTPARCRSRARLGLKDRVADRTYDATARQSANPPDPTLFVRPGTRSLVEMPICRHFQPIVWATGLGHEGSCTV